MKPVRGSGSVTGLRDNRLARVALGLVLPTAFVAATVLPLFLYRDRLPEPVATHWGFDGPNDSMSFNFLLAFELAFVGIPAAVLAGVARRRPAYAGEIAPAAMVASFVAALVSMVSWRVVIANLDAADWTDARGVGGGALALVFMGAAVVAGGTRSLARSLETAEAPAPRVPSAGLRAGERAMWLGTARAWWPWFLVVGFILAGVVLATTVHPVFGLAFGLIGVSVLCFSSIRVIADRNGVRVVYGAVGWPTQTIPLGDIRQASAIDVIPMQCGGWGYRGSLRLFGRAAVVLRGGEGIRLDLQDGRRFVVTVDGAEAGAGVINDLLARPAGS